MSDINWDEATNVNEMNRPPQRSQVVDLEVTKILGKPVLTNDPRLIRLVVKWKKETGSSADVDKMDNFLYNPGFLKELHETFK